MTSAMNFDFDGVRIFGQPYAGLCRGSEIRLQVNSKTRPCAAPDGGGVWLIRVPNTPPIARTKADQKIDMERGWVWRDYALISGGRYGGTGQIHSGWGSGCCESIFVDQEKARWVISWRAGGTKGRLLLGFMRYMHITGEQQDLVGPVSIEIPEEFWLEASKAGAELITVAQNTTGRDIVLGVIASSTAELLALVRVEIDGAVAEDEPGCGVHVNTLALLEWPDRAAGRETYDESFSGEFKRTFWSLFELRDGTTGAPAQSGETVRLEEVTINGEVENAPPLPSVSWPLSWVLVDSGYIFESSRSCVTTWRWKWERILWAAFVDDELCLLKWRYDHTDVNSWSGFWYGDSGYEKRMGYSGTSTTSYSLISEYGDNEVSKSSRSWQLPSGGDWLRGESSGLKIDRKIRTRDTRLPFWGDAAISFARPFLSSKFSNALVAVVEKQPGEEAEKVTSVWSPAGDSLSVTPGMDSARLCATWHPVTREIALGDNETVCWF